MFPSAPFAIKPASLTASGLNPEELMEGACRIGQIDELDSYPVCRASL